jgi:biopolymer transport protein ExbB/TolQ
LDDLRPAQFVEGGTNPSLALAVALSALCSVAFYWLGPFVLLRDTAVYHLFCNHGWVPYVAVFLFFVALWTLLEKIPLLARERSAFGLSLLPEATDGVIEAADAQQILNRIGRLTARQKSLLLVTRIRQALLRLNQLGTAEKLDDLLRYRADSDANAIESSYAAPKFIIWAIPVLGFVGTVIGISHGVQAFSSLIQNAADLDGLRESLKGVTYGLGQAFETTMLALCMSLALMLIMSLLQRKEDRLLAQLDDYCMEHLLHKVRVRSSVQSALNSQELTMLTEAMQAMTAELKHHRESQLALPRQPVAAIEGLRAAIVPPTSQNDNGTRAIG